MTTTELTTLVTGLWAKVKSHVTTAINGLAAVATSGSYNDLTNKPTIPDTSTLATKSELANYNPIIEDTRQNNSQALTGVAPFDELVDGQRIILNKLKFTIVNNPTLQLTLSNGTQTEAIPMWCDYAGGSALKQNWGGLVHVGGVIELLYEESNDRWVLIGLLDTNTTYGPMLQTNIDGSTSTYQSISAALLRSNFYLKSEAMAKRTLVTTGSALTATTYVDLGTTDTIAPTLPASPSRADEFVFTFTCVSASPNITLPQGVALADGFDWSEAGAGVQFQVSIQDNIAAYLVLTPNT